MYYNTVVVVRMYSYFNLAPVGSQIEEILSLAPTNKKNTRITSVRGLHYTTRTAPLRLVTFARGAHKQNLAELQFCDKTVPE